MHPTSHKFLPLTRPAAVKYRKLLPFNVSSLFPSKLGTTHVPFYHNYSALKTPKKAPQRPASPPLNPTKCKSLLFLPLQHHITHSLATMEPADAATTSTSTITITVEFTGGLEMLFDNIPSHHIKLPSKNTQVHNFTIGDLIPWLCENLMRDTRKELFVLEGNV